MPTLVPNVFTQVELYDKITETEGKKRFLLETEIEETNTILIKEEEKLFKLGQ